VLGGKIHASALACLSLIIKLNDFRGQIICPVECYGT